MTAQQERHAYYRKQGRCPNCREHRPLVEGRAYCAECLAYWRQRQRDLRQKRSEQGACHSCGRPIGEGGTANLCARCRQRNARNMARTRQERIEGHCCIRCGKPLSGQYKSCFECRVRAADWLSRYNRRKKEAAEREDV